MLCMCYTRREQLERFRNVESLKELSEGIHKDHQRVYCEGFSVRGSVIGEGRYSMMEERYGQVQGRYG